MFTINNQNRCIKAFICMLLLLNNFHPLAFEARPIKAGFEGPIYVNDECKLGITVFHQNKANNTKIILHEGLNHWKMLSNGAIVLKDNPKLGLTVYHQKITNDTKIILHEGYNLWEVLSNGAIVLKGNHKFGLTVKHQVIGNNTELILHEGYNTWREKDNSVQNTNTTAATEPSVPIYLKNGGGLGITVRYQEKKNGTNIILHGGLNNWIMRPNGAIVLRENPKLGLTVLNQNIANDAQIILHEGYNYWTVLSNGAIVLKDNHKFGLTVRHQDQQNNTKIILHEGYNLWENEFSKPNLSIITYNLHLFKTSIAVKGAQIAEKEVLFEDMARADAACDKLKSLNTDIICLQEVWGTEMQDYIKSKLIRSYPYIHIVPDVGMSAVENAITGTSGLMFASKYPIDASFFQMFEDPNKGDIMDQIEREDSWAKKGVASLILKASIPGVGKPVLLRISTTHSFTGIGNGEAAYCSRLAADIGFESFYDRIEPTGFRDYAQFFGVIVEGTGGDFSYTPGNDIPSILAGDFNLHRRNETLFTNLMDEMGSHGASEAIEQKIPNDELTDQSYTTWTAQNDLSLALNPGASGEKDRIDYIFYKGAGVLDLIDAQVIHDWTYGEYDMDISDHYPVYAKFEINKENVLDIPARNKYRVEIDACHTSIDHEGTESPIYVEFYSGNTLVAALKAKEVETNCDEANDNEYELNTRQSIDKIVVRTTGEDALFIDEIYLKKNDVVVKQYGADNGNGWCISTDENDGQSWENHKSGTGGKCWSSVTFNY